MSAARRPRHFAIVPAAGSGSRLASQIPKQYLDVAGTPMIVRTLQAFAAVGRIASTLVALAPDDTRFEALGHAMPVRVERCGGATRAATVREALSRLDAANDDWVLVHDAARCGITPALIDTLLDTLADDAVGGLLAIPVADTVKRAMPRTDARAEVRVGATVERAPLWLAQTPQMFRYRVLVAALDSADREGHQVTDEASAVELAGFRPRLVTGSPRNFKVTTPDDLALMHALLSNP